MGPSQRTGFIALKGDDGTLESSLPSHFPFWLQVVSLLSTCSPHKLLPGQRPQINESSRVWIETCKMVTQKRKPF